MIKKNTLNNFYLFIGCIGIISLYRLIPHPPNFTPIIAMTVYLPIFFGLWFLPFLLLAFAITDYFLGFHSFWLLKLALAFRAQFRCAFYFTGFIGK